MKQWVALLRNLPPQASKQAAGRAGGTHPGAHCGCSTWRCIRGYCISSWGTAGAPTLPTCMLASLATAPAACSCGRCPAGAPSSGASRPRGRCPRRASASSCSRQARLPVLLLRRRQASRRGLHLRCVALHCTLLPAPPSWHMLTHHPPLPPLPLSPASTLCTCNCILQLSLDISATPLELVHYAGDPSDCSHGIRLLTPSCSYTGGWWGGVGWRVVASFCV